MLLSSIFFIIVNGIVATFCNENIGDNSAEISTQKCNEYNNLIPNDCKKITDDLIGNNQNEVQEQEFAHMAIIGYQISNEDITWICGGVLISPQYVLTVAHCLQDLNYGPPKFVKIGTINANSTGEILRISERIQHPQYKKRIVYNDIGIIKLEKPVKFDCNKRPACLNVEKNIDKTPVIATTWHSISGGNSIDVGILNKILTELITQDSCNTTYAPSIGSSLPDGIQYDTQLCAQHKNLKNPEKLCRPDSGTPLQIHHNSKNLYDIVGLASFGKRCLDAPVVYTRISAYINWIESVVWA